MKTSFIIILSLSCVIAARGESQPTVETPVAKPKHVFAPGEFERRARESYERKSGGIIRKENSAQGKVLILNAQGRVSYDDIKAALRYIDDTIHPILEYKEITDVKISNPMNDIRKLGGRIGVVIADVEDTPALIVAPEEGWAVVNIRPLAIGNPAVDVLVSRVRKEILRAFALAGGCSFMSRGPIVVRADIHSAKDLDATSIEEYGVDVQMALGRLLPSYGVIPWRQTTYRKACREGWAPPPTNDVQKAIWNQVHAIPDKPMKIEFDPRKDK